MRLLASRKLMTVRLALVTHPQQAPTHPHRHPSSFLACGLWNAYPHALLLLCSARYAAATLPLVVRTHHRFRQRGSWRSPMPLRYTLRTCCSSTSNATAYPRCFLRQGDVHCPSTAGGAACRQQDAIRLSHRSQPRLCRIRPLVRATQSASCRKSPAAFKRNWSTSCTLRSLKAMSIGRTPFA